jgi:hypothetical protein
MATLLLAVPVVRLSSAMRSGVNTGGGLSTSRSSQCPAPVVQHSHRPVALTSITSQDKLRRQNIMRAPTSISSSHGTGGRASAVSTGFHD